MWPRSCGGPGPAGDGAGADPGPDARGGHGGSGAAGGGPEGYPPGTPRSGSRPGAVTRRRVNINGSVRSEVGQESCHGATRRSPGRPRIATTENVRAVVRALISEGVRQLSVSQFVAEFMSRLRCSRRTAFRALAEGQKVGVPWYSDTNGGRDSGTESTDSNNCKIQGQTRTTPRVPFGGVGGAK